MPSVDEWEGLIDSLVVGWLWVLCVWLTSPRDLIAGRMVSDVSDETCRQHCGGTVRVLLS